MAGDYPFSGADNHQRSSWVKLPSLHMNPHRHTCTADILPKIVLEQGR